MSYENPRISLTDTIQGAMVKMAGGNPGAITVLIKIASESPKIDPQGALGGLGTILLLDTFSIYEERIWMLYKDVCHQDIVKTLACIRGCQLGIVSEQQLNRFIDGKENTFVPEDLLEKVKEQ
ncbi:unnamed protein product, partial [marine sediment metagenome]